MLAAHTAPSPDSAPATTASTTAYDVATARLQLEHQLLRLAQLVGQRLEATLTGPLLPDGQLSDSQVRQHHARAIQAEGRLLVSLVRVAQSLRPRPAASAGRAAPRASTSAGLEALVAGLQAASARRQARAA